ncbi:MAG: histidine kinase [Gammaproteobacteria bacterium SG8_47]|nr:MAG: histidine kinase [Gammaproteobacteria bacterium SG8_47]
MAAGLTCSSCSQPGDHSRGVYLLLDTSGTYAGQLEKARHVINYLLATLEPGDTLAVARIDTGSFSENDILAKATLDDRPSRANQQKRQLHQAVGSLLDELRPSRYTDITGGILQAIEFLNEKAPARRTILIFSDLQEELPKGFVRDIDLKLAGYEVVALNVTKLRADNVDPREYMTRLEAWRDRVQGGGGSWRVINDLEHLEALIAS